ncbi:unnamed protein product [Parascedosporium putredinis]|uniref:Uncharacterized protein n=1 Tax=Parascedosporium putredinis TaxID=1442378 RepID=A0A9P1MBH8_9PEZI|nr:unnamed protein product [Parascedosporium putredinis]CAI7996245.1 unnamed protein product [Parascedosporium putredinis]
MTKLALASAVAGLAATTLAAPTAIAAPYEPINISYSGTCSNETLNSVTVLDNQLNIKFGEFDAMLGGPDDPLKRFSFCAAHMEITGGLPGYKLSAKRVSGQGLFYGTGKVGLSLFATMFWSSEAELGVTRQIDFAAEEQTAFGSRYYESNFLDTPFLSPCVTKETDPGLLTVRMRARLSTSEPNAIGLFLGSPEAPVTENIEFEWPVEPAEPEEPVEEEPPTTVKPGEPPVKTVYPDEPEDDDDIIDSPPIIEEPIDVPIIIEEPKEGEVIVDEPEEGEVIVDEPEEGEVVVDEPEEGEVVVDEPEEGEVVVDEPEEGEVIVEEPEEGDVVVEKPKEGGVVVDEPEEGEVIVEEPEEGEVIADEPWNP